MRRKNVSFLAVSIPILLGLLFFAPSYGAHIRFWLSPQVGLSGAGDASLAAENEALKAQLAELQAATAELPHASANFLPAVVYSRYPLNFKSEITINAGADNGVAAGKAAVFQGILIGTVDKVFPESSVIRTIFDGNFKMPVRIGSHGYDGLLLGGADPKVISIPKGAKVENGDVVYSAAEGLPYGMPVAVVDATGTSADDLFTEASLRFAYDLNMVQAILIGR